MCLMIRSVVLLFLSLLGVVGLSGCDNRTQEAVRWDQIAVTLHSDTEKVQMWKEAENPWRNEKQHSGVAW
jgi:hypothetical protein